MYKNKVSEIFIGSNIFK